VERKKEMVKEASEGIFKQNGKKNRCSTQEGNNSQREGLAVDGNRHREKQYSVGEVDCRQGGKKQSETTREPKGIHHSRLEHWTTASILSRGERHPRRGTRRAKGRVAPNETPNRAGTVRDEFKKKMIFRPTKKRMRRACR